MHYITYLFHISTFRPLELLGSWAENEHILLKSNICVIWYESSLGRFTHEHPRKLQLWLTHLFYDSSMAYATTKV